MGRLVLPKYRVVRDTREHEGCGWLFETDTEDHRSPRCLGTVTDTLRTGDYSVQGYEDLVSVERKNDFSELWTNYQNRKRFEAEMERLAGFKYRLVVIEACLGPDILSLSPPQLARVPGKALVRWLMGLVARYQVPIIPAGSCGKPITKMFFTEIIRREKDRWTRQ